MFRIQFDISQWNITVTSKKVRSQQDLECCSFIKLGVGSRLCFLQLSKRLFSKEIKSQFFKKSFRCKIGVKYRSASTIPFPAACIPPVHVCKKNQNSSSFTKGPQLHTQAHWKKDTLMQHVARTFFSTGSSFCQTQPTNSNLLVQTIWLVVAWIAKLLS